MLSVAILCEFSSINTFQSLGLLDLLWLTLIPFTRGRSAWSNSSDETSAIISMSHYKEDCKEKLTSAKASRSVAQSLCTQGQNWGKLKNLKSIFVRNKLKSEGSWFLS